MDRIMKKGWIIRLSLVVTSLVFCTSAFAVPFHVTHLWHMHQPIYYPYESVQDTDNNGRFPYHIQSSVFDGDRQNAYQYWPPTAVSSAHDRGMAHGGSQVSYSGSLGENVNNLGYTTSNYKDARNNKRTSLNNPRLDIVGIAYHHSLMPLTCKESMIMQIRLHKEQYMDRWGTSEYSKGFWPPECAFDESMIPALVEEGLEWVIVDNGHLFRTVSDFPWNSASSCKPNQADVINGSSADLSSQWVNLQNIWAPTAVLAPWSYQPHYVQHVDPESGAIQRIIAMPAGRYEGNENGRGGYGSFKPENVWGSHTGANSDSSHPMMILCHSDGDNYGMKNSDAWNGQHNLFLDMCQANADFEYTSVQDYLDMYPPSPSDVIHVEPGSWIGIDGGTPYYEKWLSPDYQGSTNPDRWSWSVLVAAQNRVILADSLDNNYSMNDVEWGIGNDTAKAWHWYLNAETSCYWYWDHSGEPWDGNPTRACNQAVAHAMNVINAHSGQDNKGPSIFPPQRNYYNPGSYMWDPADPQPSDFTVWSYVDDVSGLQSVTLKWRTDKDGYNPISSTQNETYAGGNEVNSWNSVPMTGSWDPAAKVSVCPDATARAQKYSGDITGQNNVLIDYYIEALDGQGNVSKSEIIHVYVGDAQVQPPPEELSIPLVQTYPGASKPDNPTLNPGEELWVDAFTSGGTPTAVTLNYSIDGGSWQTTAMASNPEGGAGVWHAGLGTFSLDSCVEFYVTATDGTDNATNDNNGSNYNICCVDAGSGEDSDVVFDPSSPSGCGPVEIKYYPNDGPLKDAAQIKIHVGNNEWADVVDPDPSMTQSGDYWTYTYDPPAGTYQIDCVFNDGSGTWDNNDQQDWHVAVTGCGSVEGIVITSPADDMQVGNETSSYDLGGQCSDDIAGQLEWENQLTGDSGTIAAAVSWSISGVPLAVGANTIVVSGSDSGSAQERAADDASDAAYNSGWADGSNGGYGFGAWSLVPGENANHFKANSSNAALDMGDEAWGSWGHSGDTATAYRPFDSALVAGETFSMDFENGGIEPGYSVGIALQNSDGDYLFEFMFVGGQTNYVINDQVAGRDSGVSWRGDGFPIALTLTGTDTYSVDIGDATLTGTLKSRGNQSIVMFRAWCYSPGSSTDGDHDFFINNMKISSFAIPDATFSDSVVITRLDGIEDTDSDGIDDDWENDNFGNLDDANGATDWDKDGLTDYEESCAGTHPKQAGSCFEMTTSAYSQTPVGDEYIVSWSSVAGHQYDLYRSISIGSGFLPIETGIGATPPMNTYTDVVNGVSAAFYKVQTQRVP